MSKRDAGILAACTRCADATDPTLIAHPDTTEVGHLLRTVGRRALPAGTLALLMLPTAAFGQEEALNVQSALPKAIDDINTVWMILATALVFLMQAGWALL